jgi:hypothetical protein
VHSSQLTVGRIQPSITEDNGGRRRGREKWHLLENWTDVAAQEWLWRHPGVIEREVDGFEPSKKWLRLPTIQG